MIGYTFQFAWEVQLIEWCQTHIPQPAIETLSFLSNIGDTVVMVMLMAFFYLCYDRKLGKRIMYTTIISLIFAGELKNIFKRRRPYFDNENIKCLKVVDKKYDMYDVEKQGFSFPSMHSSNIVNILGTWYKSNKSSILLVFSILFSLLVGISRFVLGCHYPTDVIFGWLYGTASVIILGKVQDKLSNKHLYILICVLCGIGFLYCESADFYTSSGIAFGFIACNIVDDKYINFKSTRNIVKVILRLLFAGSIFLITSEILKLPFTDEMLEASTVFSRTYRTIRYAVASFFGLGLTPMIYKYNILKLDDKMKDE